MATRYYKCKKCKHVWNIWTKTLAKPVDPKCPECKTIAKNDLIQSAGSHGSWNVRIGNHQ